jgi:hypothetical protein
MKLLRSILALAAGYVAWVVGFMGPAIVLVSVWPALQEPARMALGEGRYDVFDTSMLVSFQLIWPFANGAAGFVARLIAKRRIEVWVGAALLVAYFAYNHLWRLWGVMPDWYNVVVVLLVGPAVVVGNSLAERIARQREGALKTA